MDLIFRIYLASLLLLTISSCMVLSFRIDTETRRVPGAPKIHVHSPRRDMMEGQALWLHCNASGDPTPKVRWYLNRVVFSNATRTFSNGTMHLTRVDLGVAGLWQCKAENGKGIAQSSVIPVFVKAPAVVKRMDVSPGRNVSRGTVVEFKCVGYGSLPMGWTWYKDGQKLKRMYDGRLIRRDSEVVYVRLNRSATMKCSLKNRHGTDNKTVNIFVHNAGALPTRQPPTTPVATTTSRPPVRCQVYKGSVCTPWLLPGHRWAHDPTRQGPISLRKLEKVVRKILRALDTAELSKDRLERQHCTRGMKAMVCGRAFPVCAEAGLPSASPQRPQVGRLCREHCDAVRLLFCPRVPLFRMWKLLQRADLDAETLRSFLPDPDTAMCKGLPLAIPPQAHVDAGDAPAAVGGNAASKASPSPPRYHCTMVDFEPERRGLKNINDECFSRRGALYNGTAHEALSSVGTKPLACARWNDTEVAPVLSRRGYSVVAFPSLKTAGRSCRNPAGLEKRPFCVPQNPTKREESAIVMCKLMTCDERYDDQQERNVATFNFLGISIKQEKMFLIIVILIIVFVCFVMLISYCIFCQRYYSSKSYKMNRSGDRTDASRIHASLQAIGSSIGASVCSEYEGSEARSLLMTPNQDYHGKALQEFISPQLQKLEYPRGDINDIKELGRGAFGEVYLVEAPKLGVNEDNQPKRVAMKVLKNDAVTDMQIQFLREATLLADLDHKNIVQLLGISLVYKPFCMLMEYMSHGDLNSFLRRHDPYKTQTVNLEPTLINTVTGRSSVNGYIMANGAKFYPPETPIVSPMVLDRVNLCRMAVDISEGMIYLSHLNYVHRDLASRNCLMDHNFTVKIADFGLCRHIRRGEDFIDDDHGAMPIRWMPLESILERRFNLDTDVWSFGVLLWELFSFALQPYYGKTHDEVIEFLQKGSYLDKPPAAPDNVYRLMLRCWSRQRRERPTFAWLMRQLSELLRRWQEQERVT